MKSVTRIKEDIDALLPIEGASDELDSLLLDLEEVKEYHSVEAGKHRRLAQAHADQLAAAEALLLSAILN